MVSRQILVTIALGSLVLFAALATPVQAPGGFFQPPVHDWTEGLDYNYSTLTCRFPGAENIIGPVQSSINLIDINYSTINPGYAMPQQITTKYTGQPNTPLWPAQNMPQANDTIVQLYVVARVSATAITGTGSNDRIYYLNYSVGDGVWHSGGRQSLYKQKTTNQTTTEFLLPTSLASGGWIFAYSNVTTNASWTPSVVNQYQGGAPPSVTGVNFSIPGSTGPTIAVDYVGLSFKYVRTNFSAPGENETVVPTGGFPSWLSGGFFLSIFGIMGLGLMVSTPFIYAANKDGADGRLGGVIQTTIMFFLGLGFFLSWVLIPS